MPRPVRTIVALAAALTLAAPALPGLAAEPPAGTAPPAGSARPAVPGETTLTLVTGDKVTMRGSRLTRIAPAPGRQRMTFSQFSLGGELHVIPADAGRLIAADRIDDRLFNISRLLRWRYDDRSRPSLPLIAERPAARLRSAVAGSRLTRTLPAGGVAALDVAKSGAGTFWSEIAGSRSLGAGIDRLWLDGRVSRDLDRSGPQVGAPAAWQRGLTGAGTTVAVLDTGVDTGHPGLTGRITATRGFTPAGPGDVQDIDGHGTHVATTATGSGAGSPAGAHRGIAPDAGLAVGKVLDDFGSGQESWLLAGIEWAATEADADVVNLSLGGTDVQGEDPLEQAVNRLSATTGALFVISAGNSGADGARTVGSPGSADAALTVGAVDRRDRIAPFSSRGPRVGDQAIKPDVTAPGVGIVAGFPGGDYGPLSGTSMAAPHVTGAAALLRQQHPDWSGEHLKAALIGSARPADGLDPFTQGAGRIDLAAAVDQPVTATPGNLSTYLRSPQQGPVARRLTYTNSGDLPVTLQLSAPPAPFRPAARTLTVPARGAATLAVTIDPALVRPGAYTAVLAATTGATVIRTLLGAYVEPPARELTLEVTDRLGRPAEAMLLMHSRTSAFREWVQVSGGAARVRLPVGGYNVAGLVDTPEDEGDQRTLVNAPVLLTADQRLRIDTRDAVRPTMTVDEPTAAGPDSAVVGAEYRNGTAGYVVGADWPGSLLSVLPVRQDGLSYFQYREFVQAGSSAENPSPYSYHVVDLRDGGIPADPSYHARTGELATVSLTLRATRPDESGQLQTFAHLPGDLGRFALVREMPLPHTVREYVTANPRIRWSHSLLAGLPHTFEHHSNTTRPRSYPLGRHQETWNAAVLGPALPDSCQNYLAGPVPCGIREENRIDWDGASAAATDAGGRGRGGSIFPAGTAVLERDGTELARHDLRFGPLIARDVPPEPADFRLTTSVRRDDAPLSTAVETVHRFRSGYTGERTALPLIVVRHRAGGLDDLNRARPSSTSTLSLWVEKYTPESIRSLTLQVSDDDGRTWRDVEVQPTGSGWQATVTNPASGYVSLRAGAVGSAGSSVSQTVLRAYPIG